MFISFSTLITIGSPEASLAMIYGSYECYNSNLGLEMIVGISEKTAKVMHTTYTWHNNKLS